MAASRPWLYRNVHTHTHTAVVSISPGRSSLSLGLPYARPAMHAFLEIALTNPLSTRESCVSWKRWDPSKKRVGVCVFGENAHAPQRHVLGCKPPRAHDTIPDSSLLRLVLNRTPLYCSLSRERKLRPQRLLLVMLLGYRTRHCAAHRPAGPFGESLVTGLFIRHLPPFSHFPLFLFLSLFLSIALLSLRHLRSRCSLDPYRRVVRVCHVVPFRQIFFCVVRLFVAGPSGAQNSAADFSTTPANGPPIPTASASPEPAKEAARLAWGLTASRGSGLSSTTLRPTRSSPC